MSLVFSLSVTLLYFPFNSVQKFGFLHTLANIIIITLFIFDDSPPKSSDMVVVCVLRRLCGLGGMCLLIICMLLLDKCLCRPLASFKSLTVLTTFVIELLDFSKNILWILTSYKTCGLQIFSFLFFF